MPTSFDVIVVGAGHAGVEATLVCARMNLQVLVATTKLSSIAHMSCNPAIGGLAKGNLVKEIDVLGGVMGVAADASCLQYKHLNCKKGPAVRGSRMQCDKKVYQTFIQHYLRKQKNISFLEEEISSFWIQHGRCVGVIQKNGVRVSSKAVILTAGTFMKAVMHIGGEQKEGGRVGEKATTGLSVQMARLGFSLTRLKTGTPPRLHRDSIDWNQLCPQGGDKKFRPFSFFSSKQPPLKQELCYLSYTNEQTHEIIRKHLHLSPLFSGKMTGTGPRYCPSIEDKITRFCEKKSHQTFLEPEEQNSISIYLQGLSTSLPFFVQEKFVQSIKGLERAKIIQPGYAVEYDFLNPIQIKPTLETKLISGLYFAGQINGSSGYEEAASQGLLAGINAASKILNLPELILPRYQAYTGVLIDDLVTKGTNEPYRMLTSRAEYRLLLREDNTAERLFPVAKKYSLLSQEKQNLLEELLEKRKQYKSDLQKNKWKASHIASKIPTFCFQNEDMISAQTLLKRPDVSINDLEILKMPKISLEIAEPVEIEIKYKGYIDRQNQIIEKNKKMGEMTLSLIDYNNVQGLSLEARDQLKKVQPKNLDQATRIMGVSPASIQALIIHVQGQRNERLKKRNQKFSESIE